MELSNIFVIIFVLLLFVGLLLFIFWPKGKEPKWKENVRRKSASLYKQVQSNEEFVLKSVIIEYDKLVDFIFRKKNLKGNTMGERLKNAKNLFSKQDYNALWQAHKLRNRIAHEHDLKVGVKELKAEARVFNSLVSKVL